MQDLEGLLDELEQAPHGDSVSVGQLIEAVGRRSFGPLLVLPGLFVVSPLGGIPGMATTMGLLSLLVSVQMLLHRSSFWLPRWLLRRRLRSDRLRQALRAMRRPARWIDRLLRPRLQWTLHPPALQLIALGCVSVALVMPLLEVVPFADSAPGAALIAFGLGLIAHDGALALAAASLCALTLGIAGLAIVN